MSLYDVLISSLLCLLLTNDYTKLKVLHTVEISAFIGVLAL